MKEYKPFDENKRPKIPYPYLMAVEWGGTVGMLPLNTKITKINCKGLKPPYILLANHGSFIDFPIAVKAIFPRRVNWLISIEEFNGREWLMRGIGGIYKRKFTSDLTNVRHILWLLKKKKRIVVIYPEARFSLAGINEKLDGSYGKLVKTAKCPVVTLIAHGNFLNSPQWNKHPKRRVPIRAEMKQIVTAEEALSLTAEEIQQRIENAFSYDEYQWQYENKIKISSKARANNIHRILYQCPVCGKEFCTDSKDTEIWCENCGARWMMDEYGRLHRTDGGDDIFSHVPDWYRWEREQVRKQVRDGSYSFEDTARVEELVNCRDAGFIPLGEVRFTHDMNGFTLQGTLDDGTTFDFNRSVISMYSCHIEYNFKGRGDAIDLATKGKTYFIFPLTARNVLTKIHFAEEEMHNLLKEQEQSK